MTQHSKIISALTASVCMFTLVADAEANERWPRWYIGLSTGVAFVEDSELSGAAAGDLEYDTGLAGTIALGYMPFFGSEGLDNVRAEAEFGYRYQSLDGFNGDASMFTYMANAYYDFNSDSQWTPYVGAGLGAASVDLSSTGLGNVNDDDTVFAYQFLGGVTYAPKTMPMTEWGFGYRYFTADSPDYQTAAGASLGLDDITSHNIEATARFRF